MERTVWKSVTLPRFFERQIAFSAIEREEFLVVSYDGAHLIRLEGGITVETAPEMREYESYDPDTGIARYRGRQYTMLGLHGGRPRTRSELDECLGLDQERSILEVSRAGTLLHTLKYEDLSGDWVHATFSPDDHYIMVGCPYEIFLWRRPGF